MHKPAHGMDHIINFMRRNLRRPRRTRLCTTAFCWASNAICRVSIATAAVKYASRFCQPAGFSSGISEFSWQYCRTTCFSTVKSSMASSGRIVGLTWPVGCPVRASITGTASASSSRSIICNTFDRIAAPGTTIFGHTESRRRLLLVRRIIEDRLSQRIARCGLHQIHPALPQLSGRNRQTLVGIRDKHGRCPVNHPDGCNHCETQSPAPE